MTTEVEASTRRKRGSIRRMGVSLQVRVSAGDDPSTGERIVLVEVVPIEKLGNDRSERAASDIACNSKLFLGLANPSTWSMALATRRALRS